MPFLRRPEKPWERRLTLFQRLWGILVIPAVTFWDIAHEPDRKGPFLIFLGNLMILSLFFVVMMLRVFQVWTYGLVFGFGGIILVNALLYLVWNVIYFGIMHLIVKLSGREGEFAETFLMGQYASLPLLIANILSLGILFVLLPTTSIDNLILLFISPAWLIVWALTSAASLWGAVLLALGLRERYRLSTAAALAITFGVTLFAVVVSFFARVTII